MAWRIRVEVPLGAGGGVDSVHVSRGGRHDLGKTVLTRRGIDELPVPLDPRRSVGEAPREDERRVSGEAHLSVRLDRLVRLPVLRRALHHDGVEGPDLLLASHRGEGAVERIHLVWRWPATPLGAGDDEQRKRRGLDDTDHGFPPYVCAAFTRSGVKGRSRMRRPVALATALAIAATVGPWADSPEPTGRSSGRSISETSTDGTSVMHRSGYSAPDRVSTIVPP